MLRLVAPSAPRTAAAAQRRHFARQASTSVPRNAPSTETQARTADTGVPVASSSSAAAAGSHGAPGGSTFSVASGLGVRSLTRRQRRVSAETRSQAEETEAPQRAKLSQILGMSEDSEVSPLREPSWLVWARENPELARLFSVARSRLWMPHDISEEELESRIHTYGNQILQKWAQLNEALSYDSVQSDEALRNYATQHAAMALERAQAWATTSREEQLDIVVQPDWAHLTPEERSSAILRTRFECVRRLGWRKGYSSGYPLSQKATGEERSQRAKLLELLRETKKSSRQQALEMLREQEDRLAKAEWVALPELARKAEERAAWEARDRSLVFLDDTSSSHVLGCRAIRWFATPQRAGAMTFLPNTLIRLVPNNTPRNGKYDVFKATFRVPLDMHKHSVRSYLMSIYGLRTTWVRSMVYRSRIRRNRRGQLIQRNGSRSTYKKVEVGLLEPFIFPDVTPAFKRKHLNSMEHEMEQQALLFKMSGRRRWRARKLASPLTSEPSVGAVEESPAEEATEEEARLLNSRLPHERLPASRRQDRSLFWGGGAPTKRHSRILTMIRQKRAETEKRITARSASLQAETEAAEARARQEEGSAKQST